MQLFLNDIGTWEVLLILGFILVFFGSKSLPGLARTFGRTISQIRNASDELQTEIRKSGAKITKDMNMDKVIRDTADDFARPIDQYAKDVEDVMSRRPTFSQPKKHSTTNSNIPKPQTKDQIEAETPKTDGAEPVNS